VLPSEQVFDTQRPRLIYTTAEAPLALAVSQDGVVHKGTKDDPIRRLLAAFYRSLPRRATASAKPKQTYELSVSSILTR
jgi:hypothetical protein